jgi:hypothetical protein
VNIVIQLSISFHSNTNTTGAASGAETRYPSGTFEFTTGFSGVRCVRFLDFSIAFCTLLFVGLFQFAIVMSLIRYTTSDYTFAIFKLFVLEPCEGKRCCL